MTPAPFPPPPAAEPSANPGGRSGDGRLFLREALRDPRATGAIAPSGRALARALTEPASGGGCPLTVLEVGAGTGTVTQVLMARLPAGSELDVVEANPRFAGRLRRLTDAGHASSRCSARIHRARVEAWPTARRYDVIVSALPFTNLPPAQVDAVMRRYLELLRPGGTLTYMAYLVSRPARRLLTTGEEARRHSRVTELLTWHRRRYAAEYRRVWWNLPPAGVWYLRRPAAVTSAPGRHTAGAVR